jgi:hypothetical protein
MSATTKPRKDIHIEYHPRRNAYLIGELVGNRVIWTNLQDTDLERAKAKAYEHYGSNIIITHN